MVRRHGILSVDWTNVRISLTITSLTSLKGESIQKFHRCGYNCQESCPKELEASEGATNPHSRVALTSSNRCDGASGPRRKPPEDAVRGSTGAYEVDDSGMLSTALSMSDQQGIGGYVECLGMCQKANNSPAATTTKVARDGQVTLLGRDAVRGDIWEGARNGSRLRSLGGATFGCRIGEGPMVEGPMVWGPGSSRPEQQTGTPLVPTQNRGEYAVAARAVAMMSAGESVGVGIAESKSMAFSCPGTTYRFLPLQIPVATILKLFAGIAIASWEYNFILFFAPLTIEGKVTLFYAILALQGIAYKILLFTSISSQIGIEVSDTDMMFFYFS